MRKLGFGLVAVLAATATVASAQQVKFKTAATDFVATGAEGIALADVNGDTFADILFPEGQTAALGVLYGRGDGTFDLQRDYPAGTSPIGVVVGNFDGDATGYADFATIDSNSQLVSVLTGQGEREFATDSVTSDVGATALTAIAAGLLDDDQILDLAITSSGGQGRIAILRGQGDGTFQPIAGSPFPAGAMTEAIVLADVNGDLRPDVIATNRDAGTVTVLLNVSNGVFQAAANSPFPAGESPYGLAVEDWTGDGAKDIAVANRNVDRFSLLVGSGSGSFATPVSFPTGSFPAALVGGDFDDDGKMDIAVANKTSYDVTIAWGDGKGGFPSQRRYLSGEEPIALVAAKLDADRLPDITVLNKNISAVDTYTILMAQPGRAFAGVETFPAGTKPVAIAVADLNGDGRTDIVSASDSDSQLHIMRARAAGGADTATFEITGTARGIALADMNKDGRADLLLVQIGGGESGFLGFAPGNGRGSFGPVQPVAVGEAPAAVDVADFDGDWNLDAVVTLGRDDAVAVVLGRGDGTFTGATLVGTRPDGVSGEIVPIAVAARDLDGDGSVDLAVAHYQDDGFLSLLYGRGDGTFEAPVALPSGRRPLAVAVTDLDNDGMLDIISANEDTWGMLIHRATAARTYAPPPSTCCSMGKVPAALALRDVNGDGILDALVADRTDDLIVIRTGRTTSPYFGSSRSVPTGRTPLAVASGDFDDSGAYDVVTANNGGANVAVALSATAGTFVRGDGNQDGALSAADVVAVMRTLPAAHRLAVEYAVRSGLAPTGAVDADGDGVLSLTDCLGVAGKLFRG